MLQRPSLPHMPGPQTPASPPHNPYPHVPPLKPHKSPLLPPHCTQAMTPTSPLHHMQVCWHHPVVVCKTCCDTALMPSQHGVQAWLQRQPTLWKPHHGATPMQHASPTMVLTCHTRALPWHAGPTITPTCCMKTSPPQHSVQVSPCQPIAHGPHCDTTHHGAMQKPHHQPTMTPYFAPLPSLLTFYSSTS